MLMTLLPLVGWATDYEVQVTTYDGTATWTGAKPDVKPDWFSATFVGGGALPPAQKAIIATGLKVKDVDGRVYNAGTYEYQLALKGSQTINDPGSTDTYKIYLNSSTTATLTINKILTAPTVDATGLAYVAGELMYDGSAHALLATGATALTNAVEVPVVYATSAAAETWYSLADLKETNAGTYTVYYKVAETVNYAGSDPVAMTTTRAIAQANTAAFNVKAVTGLVFNNTDQALLALTDDTKPIVPFGLKGLQYQIDGGSWTAFTTLDAITGKSAKNAVAYAVKFKIPADESANANWAEITSDAIDVTIDKATPTFISWPTTANQGLATGLKYNETAQTLALTQAVAKITPAVGDAFEVPVKYELRRSYSDGTSGQTSWSTKSFDNLKGTYAGQYWIRYSVVGTDDYNGLTAGNAKSANTIIAKADIPTASITAPVAKEGMRTTGAAQELITTGSVTDEKYGAFQYSLTNNGTDWAAEIPKGTDAGNYTVYYRIYPPVTSNAQNYDIVSGNVVVTIAAKSKVTITIPANQSFGYGTTPTLEYTPTWEAKGSDVLKEEGLTWTWYTGATGDTQASKVGGYYPAGEYYVMVGGLAVDGTTAASQEIVYPTDRQKVKITAGQIVASIDASSTYGGALTYTLTHKSGLSTTEAATLNANSTVKTVTIKNKETGAIVTYKDGDENKELKDVVLNSEAEGYNAAAKAALEKLNAGTYTLEATAEYTPNTNYALLVSAGTLTVGAKSIAGATFTVTTAADAIVYNAKDWGTTENPIAFTVTETSGIEAADYDVAYSNNKNAGTATITLTGKRNYTGNISTTFTIKKADLTITADNFTGETAWTYGKTEPTYTVSSTGYADGTLAVGGTVVGVDDNNDETEDNLVLAIRRTSNETVGMHAGAIEPYFTKGGVAQVLAYDVPLNTIALNYNITLVKGDLQVAKNAITIKLKNNVITGTYGNAPSAAITAEILTNKANYELDNCELTDGNLGDILDVSGVSFSMVNPIENNKYEVNDAGYEFTMTGAATTNYAVTISNGTYKVSPSAIKLYAKNQTIDWSVDATATPNKNVSDETVGIDTENSGRGLQCGDDLTDLVASIDIVSTNVGENVINLTFKTNANYTVTWVPGKLTVTGAATLAMTSDYDEDDNWFSTIQSYNSKAVTVKLTVNRTQTLLSGKKYTWKGEEWNAFILPFAITPKQLSDAFGYAIVNVVNPSASTADNIAFKLQMSGTIPANTPFMLKNYEAVAPGTEITLGSFEIVAPASKEVSVDAGGGWTFIGSYDKKTIAKNNSDIYYYNGEGAWKHLGTESTNTWNIAPFNAYMLQPTAGAKTREITFTFEELDGSATVIKSVSDESTDTVLEGWYTINGIKLESAPTQKGIYIKDGKKVVIKTNSKH